MPTSLTGRVSEVLRLDAAYIHSQHVHLLNLLGRRLPSLDQPDHMQAIRLVHIRLATGDGLVVTRPQSPAPVPFFVSANPVFVAIAKALKRVLHGEVIGIEAI